MAGPKWAHDILGDSGASDGDTFFINPYHSPTDGDKCWFNFCHSSTRFFVEQIFGIWKSRFRFLLNPVRVNHKLTTQLIYASCVLHNMFVVRARDDVSLDPADPHWASFLAGVMVRGVKLNYRGTANKEPLGVF